MSNAEAQARQIAVSELARSIADLVPINAAEVNQAAELCGFSRENLRKNLLRAGLRQDNFVIAAEAAGLPPTTAYWWVDSASARMSDDQAVELTRSFVEGQYRREIDYSRIQGVENDAFSFLSTLYDEKEWDALRDRYGNDWNARDRARKSIERDINAYVEKRVLPRYGR